MAAPAGGRRQLLRLEPRRDAAYGAVSRETFGRSIRASWPALLSLRAHTKGHALPSTSNILCRESDARVADLRRKLDEFYSTTSSYESFEAPSLKPDFWGPIAEDVRRHVASGATCRILEFGAGRTAFPSFLGELRVSVRFHAQDVATQNRAFLQACADEVFIADLSTIAGPYDILFSTFVWEHITNPHETLGHLFRLLAPGGRLYIACPRYDFPLYLSPSARHYPRAKRLAIGLRLFFRRLRVALGGSPEFLIHVDPCVLHRPWFRDADAIHWASLFDLRRALPPGATIESLPVPRDTLKGKLSAALLLIFVRITKPGAASPSPVEKAS